jgi:hypothetical protein
MLTLAGVGAERHWMSHIMHNHIDLYSKKPLAFVRLDYDSTGRGTLQEGVRNDMKRA